MIGRTSASSHTLPAPISNQVDCIKYETGSTPGPHSLHQKQVRPVSPHFLVSFLNSRQTVMCFNVRFINIAALDKYLIAGRVHVCCQNWAQITMNPWILDTVQGYQLELESIPVQRSPPPGLHWSPQECNLVEREIEKLIQKGVVAIPSRPSAGLVHQSDICCSQKRRKISTSCEPEGLEQSHEVPPLKNGKGSSAENFLQKGDWMVPIDLKDAYLSMSVAQHYRHLLRFMWKEKFLSFSGSIPTFHCPLSVYQGK